MKQRHVTLADVAKRADVSVATASRALGGLGANKQNLTRVEKAATELGYVKNEAARALRNVKTMTIGLVFRDLVGTISIELIDAISSLLEPEGYHLMVSAAQGDSERFDGLVHNLLERRVDALICVNPVGVGGSVERYARAGIPVLSLITKTGGYSDLPLITPNSSCAIGECIEHLKNLGHSSVEVFMPEGGHPALMKFSRDTQTLGIAVKVRKTPVNTHDFLPFIQAFQSSNDNPSVIVAMDPDAAQILATCELNGLTIPASLSLVSIRDSEIPTPISGHQLSHVHIDAKKFGEKVASVVLQSLNQGMTAEKEIFADSAEWIPGSTTGTAPR